VLALLEHPETGIRRGGNGPATRTRRHREEQ
jgi:hypothetical protein